MVRYIRTPPMLVALTYAQAPCCPKLSEYGHVSQLFSFMSHIWGQCWPNIRRIAYTFRVSGPVFKAAFFFFSCTLSPLQYTSGVDYAHIRPYSCCFASFSGSYAQLHDTPGQFSAWRYKEISGYSPVPKGNSS